MIPCGRWFFIKLYVPFFCRNFDALLVQTKPSDLERFVDSYCGGAYVPPVQGESDGYEWGSGRLDAVTPALPKRQVILTASSYLKVLYLPCVWNHC
jgi:hypothetical protein